MDQPDQGNTLSTIETGMAILEFVFEQEGARVTQVADRFEMSQSSAHRYLHTLELDGYLVKEDSSYQLSLAFLGFGEQARTRRQEYREAEPYTQALAEETGHRSTFMIEEHGRGIYLYTAAGKHGVWTKSTIGKRVPLTVTAAGKAILASLPEERRETVLRERGLPRLTPHSLTDRDELLADLEAVRERGYAFNREEQIEGVKSVGAPILTSDGGLVGAFSVSGPANRMKDDILETELKDAVLGIANEYELRVSLS